VTLSAYFPNQSNKAQLDSRTIAAFVLNEHPQAITARVSLFAYRVPALREAARGARPALEEFHWAEYRRP